MPRFYIINSIERLIKFLIYNFLNFNNYQLLVSDKNNAYINEKNIARFLNDDKDIDKLIADLNKRCKNNSSIYKDISYIEFNGDVYFLLDIVILSLLDFNFKASFSLFDSVLSNGISLLSETKETINNEKESFKILNTITSNNSKLVTSYKKYLNTGNEIKTYGHQVFISLETIQILISLLKENNDLNKDFGEIRDYSLLIDILYDIGTFEFNELNKKDDLFIDEDDISSILEVAFKIIKYKPFINGNELIALFVIIYSLEKSGLLLGEELDAINSEDINLSLGLILNSNEENLIEILKQVKSLLSKHYFLSNDLNNEYKLEPIVDTSLEGIINYIITSIEEFYGNQGYYDYFKSKNGEVYKLHYRGVYNNFSLDSTKTFISNKTLYFTATLYCFSSLPLDLENKDNFINGIVDEIKSRSYKDVIIPFLNKLKEKVKPYFDLDTISIKFHFEIKTKFDTCIE